MESVFACGEGGEGIAFHTPPPCPHGTCHIDGLGLCETLVGFWGPPACPDYLAIHAPDQAGCKILLSAAKSGVRQQQRICCQERRIRRWEKRRNEKEKKKKDEQRKQDTSPYLRGSVGQSTTTHNDGTLTNNGQISTTNIKLLGPCTYLYIHEAGPSHA